MARSDKLYKDSPKIEKDENGTPGMSKPKEADAENMGIEGAPLEGAGDGMPVTDPHAVERAEVSKRHMSELKDMYRRHEAEYDTMRKRHHPDASSDDKAKKKDKE